MSSTTLRAIKSSACTVRSLCSGPLPSVLAPRAARTFATSTHPASLRQKLTTWLGMPHSTPPSSSLDPTTKQAQPAQSAQQPTLTRRDQASAATPAQQPNSPSHDAVANSTSCKVVDRDAALMRQMQDREGLSPGDSMTSDHLHGAMGTQTRNNLFRYVSCLIPMSPRSDRASADSPSVHTH